MIEFKINAFKSIDPGFEISNKISKLQTLQDNINVANKDIIKKVVRYGETIAKANYSVSPSTGTARSNVLSKLSTNENNGYIAFQGPQVFYEEFGTGEEGAANPHPMKSLFQLNPYNSGPYVSTHVNKKNGKHFWFYSPLAGQPYFESGTGYTEGTPSGKIMYNTSKDLEKRATEIAKEILEQAIKTKALK